MAEKTKGKKVRVVGEFRVQLNDIQFKIGARAEHFESDASV